MFGGLLASFRWIVADYIFFLVCLFLLLLCTGICSIKTAISLNWNRSMQQSAYTKKTEQKRIITEKHKIYVTVSNMKT